MPRTCTICKHSRRDDIDKAATVGGTDSLRKISQDFAVSYDALYRHVNGGHIPQQLAKAEQAKEIASADKLLKIIEGLLSECLVIVKRARGDEDKTPDDTLKLKAIKEARETAKLLLEVAGKLSGGPQVNVFTAPEWVKIEAVILQVLEPHPELRQQLADALAGVKV